MKIRNHDKIRQLINHYYNEIEIEVYSESQSTWTDASKRAFLNDELKEEVVRISPECAYAKETVKNKGGYGAYVMYRHWLSGGEIKVKSKKAVKSWLAVTDPFNYFVEKFCTVH